MVLLLQQNDLAAKPGEQGRRRAARRPTAHDQNFALTIQ